MTFLLTLLTLMANHKRLLNRWLVNESLTQTVVKKNSDVRKLKRNCYVLSILTLVDIHFFNVIHLKTKNRLKLVTVTQLTDTNCALYIAVSIGNTSAANSHRVPIFILSYHIKRKRGEHMHRASKCSTTFTNRKRC